MQLILETFFIKNQAENSETVKTRNAILENFMCRNLKFETLNSEFFTPFPHLLLLLLFILVT